MKHKLYYFIGLFVAVLAMGCEDLEDTYDEWLGDGVERYVGRTTKLTVQPGWERLQVSWENHLDAAIDSVKITWQSEQDTRPYVRMVKPKNQRDTISIGGLRNAVYTIKVSNIANNGSESVAEEMVSRPYTYEHEGLRAFNRGITNFYRLNDKLVVTVDDDNSNMIKMLLHYYDKTGEKQTWNIKKNMSEYLGTGSRRLMYRLPVKKDAAGIDFSRPITVEREGLLSECIDTISFLPDTLNMKEVVWSPSFTSWLTKNYGPDWESQVDNIETVELDYDISSLQDLFYFPNLKKVVLGKNRYVEIEDEDDYSKTDSDVALFTLQYLRDERQVKVERYGEHYIPKMLYGYYSYIDVINGFGYGPILIDDDLITERNWDNLENQPDVDLLDGTSWEVTCNDTTANGLKENGAGFLLDNDPETYFEPSQQLAATVYDVEIDMKELQDINGFKVMQPTEATKTKRDYLVSSLKIEVSEDGGVWKPATYETGGITIGNVIGEVTYIRVPETIRVRYIRLTLASRHVGRIGDNPTFSLRLSGFVPYY